MATNGQINTNTTYDSYFWVMWSQASQDIASNKTRINWSCGVYCGHSFYTNAIRMSAVSINGVQVYSGGTYSNFSKGNHTIASGTLDIAHNADGTKTFSISAFTGWLYSSYNYSSNGGSYSLTQIPRQARITAAADFTDLDNPSISISNPGGFRMDVWLEPNPVGDHICVRENIPNTGTYTWSLTAAERDALRNKCPGNNCTIRLGLYSYVGGTQYADYQDKKFTMAESTDTKPTVNMGIALNNGSLPSKFNGLYIQGKSRVNVTLDVAGKYGAGIQNYSATMEGRTYSSPSFTTDVVQTPGNVEIVGYARDTRGFSGESRQNITVIEYAKPAVVPVGTDNAILCYRSDGNGKRVGASTSVWIKAKRSYRSVSQKNTCALQWRRKLATEQWDDSVHLWNDLLPKSSAADSYNALLPGVEFALKNSYTIQIRATDDIGEQDIKTMDVPTQDVALHLGRGGKNVTIGTYCDYSEDYTFRSAWKAIFDEEIYIEGEKVANHVVEEGTDGSWKYRKWHDGTAELWSTITAIHNNGSVLGGELRYPFVLTGTIYGIGTLNSAGGNSAAALPWNIKLTYGTELCGAWVHNPGSVGFATDSTADVSVYIVGRWK
jgi:hypothetical protein